MDNEVGDLQTAIRDALGRPRLALDRADLVPAAVLVPIASSERGLEVVFTRRTLFVAAHKGQISFPGGAVEPGDRDAVATALREAREEIGLDPSRVEVVGLLDDQATASGFLVSPVVGFLPAATRLRPDPAEVAEVFGVPWQELSDPACYSEKEIEWQGQWIRDYRYTAGDRVIWGVTGRILSHLLRLVGRLPAGRCAVGPRALEPGMRDGPVGSRGFPDPGDENMVK